MQGSSGDISRSSATQFSVVPDAANRSHDSAPSHKRGGGIRASSKARVSVKGVGSSAAYHAHGAHNTHEGLRVNRRKYMAEEEKHFVEFIHEQFPQHLADLKHTAQNAEFPGILNAPRLPGAVHYEPRPLFVAPPTDNSAAQGPISAHSIRNSLSMAIQQRQSIKKGPVGSTVDGGGLIPGHSLVGLDTVDSVNGTPGHEKLPDGFQDFATIVKEDRTQAYEDYISEVLAGKLVESTPFRMVVLVAILLNTILVGIQTSSTVERNYSDVVQGLDKMFLTIFTLEILLKWYHGFWAFWKVGWNVFDFMLVAISLLGDGLDFLRSGRVLRIFRVLRAFRSLRSISALQGLQIVMQIIWRSIPDMGNVIALLLIVNFIFSVIGVDMFSEILPQHFDTIGTTMYTLFIFMTQDGWVDIYRDMEDAGVPINGALYIMVYIVIGAFIFANIFVGALVTNLTISVNEQKSRAKVKHRMLGVAKFPGAGGGGKVGNPKGEGGHSAGIASIKDVAPDLWALQTPKKIPEFQKLTIEALENYYLVLIALEENLQENLELKGHMERVLNKVKRLNKVRRNNEGMARVRGALDGDRRGDMEDEDDSGYDDDEFPAEDAFTAKLAMDRARNIEAMKKELDTSNARRRRLVLRLHKEKKHKQKQKIDRDKKKRVPGSRPFDVSRLTASARVRKSDAKSGAKRGSRWQPVPRWAETEASAAKKRGSGDASNKLNIPVSLAELERSLPTTPTMSRRTSLDLSRSVNSPAFQTMYLSSQKKKNPVTAEPAPEKVRRLTHLLRRRSNADQAFKEMSPYHIEQLMRTS